MLQFKWKTVWVGFGLWILNLVPCWVFRFVSTQAGPNPLLVHFEIGSGLTVGNISLRAIKYVLLSGLPTYFSTLCFCTIFSFLLRRSFRDNLGFWKQIYVMSKHKIQITVLSILSISDLYRRSKSSFCLGSSSAWGAQKS